MTQLCLEVLVAFIKTVAVELEKLMIGFQLGKAYQRRYLPEEVPGVLSINGNTRIRTTRF